MNKIKVNFSMVINEEDWESFKEFCNENGFRINFKAGLLIEEFVRKLKK